jgi:hypothetical protein
LFEGFKKVEVDQVHFEVAKPNSPKHGLYFQNEPENKQNEVAHFIFSKSRSKMLKSKEASHGLAHFHWGEFSGVGVRHYQIFFLRPKLRNNVVDPGKIKFFTCYTYFAKYLKKSCFPFLTTLKQLKTKLFEKIAVLGMG